MKLLFQVSFAIVLLMFYRSISKFGYADLEYWVTFFAINIFAFTVSERYNKQ